MSGIKLSSEENEKLKKSVQNLENRYKQQKVCRFCGAPVAFMQDEKGKYVPHDLDGTPHWKTCPYETLTQKRASFGILKKVAVFFCLKHPDIDIESDLGLTEKEGKVMHAILGKVLKDIEHSPSEEAQRVEGDLTFSPEPNDPIGDPDEDIAPDENLVKEASPEDLVKEE